MVTTNQDILSYLEATLEKVVKALSDDLSGLTKAQLELAAEVRQASRLSIENKERLDNIVGEAPIALLKHQVEKGNTRLGSVTNVIVSVVQAIIVALLISKLI